jgi:hypothetical protein
MEKLRSATEELCIRARLYALREKNNYQDMYYLSTLTPSQLKVDQQETCIMLLVQAEVTMWNGGDN